MIAALNPKRLCWLALLAVLASSGCSSLLNPIDAIPAHRLPPQLLGVSRNNHVDVSLARLRAPEPPEYLLDAGDVIGVYVDGILADPGGAPMVHMPPKGSDLPPAIGVPFAVRRNGTISLPLLAPIRVAGLTLAQTEASIRRAYVENKILKPQDYRVIVTLMRKRIYSVVVVREDSANQGGGAGMIRGAPESSGVRRNQVVHLEAYRNDVLNALTQTGGLPGTYAKNEVKILRGGACDFAKQDALIEAHYANVACDPCSAAPHPPRDPSVTRIPLRLPPGTPPRIRPEDVLLYDGDILLVEARDREVFYTGGLLGGGVFPLPRDFDLDVLSALSMAKQSLVASGSGAVGRSGLGGSLTGVSPGVVYILRKTPTGGQLPIKVDLTRAIRDPRARPLIQPEDVLVLQYRPREEVLNFGLGAAVTWGAASLLRR